MPEAYQMGKARWSLVSRVVSKTKVMVEGPKHTASELQVLWDLTEYDVKTLLAYYEVTPRAAFRGGSKPVDVDALAERLWLVIEPKVVDLVNQGLLSGHTHEKEVENDE